MINDLTKKFSNVLKGISRKHIITESNIKDTIKVIRKSLIESDVSWDIIKIFIESIKSKAIGQKIYKEMTAKQMFIKIVSDELRLLMGKSHVPLNLNIIKSPLVILVVGLQGSGKTTTCAKLAKYIKIKEKKNVMMVSCDIYRPAAILQLKTLAAQAEVNFFDSNENQNPITIAKNALSHAATTFTDILIVDTAGRLHIDTKMMNEIKNISTEVNPTETLFVIDSMTGQDAINSTRKFAETLQLSGIILTKTDSDYKGGVALSVAYTSKKPIKFIGTGEKLDNLELFYPDRIASKILGMGDILTLIEDIKAKGNLKDNQKIIKKIESKQKINLNDLRNQLKQMNKMGGIKSVIDKLPGMNNIPESIKNKLNNNEYNKMVSIIDSMTKKERVLPEIINGSRKRRIAHGSGTNIQCVNRLLKHHSQMQKMIKKFPTKGNIFETIKNKFPSGIF